MFLPEIIAFSITLFFGSIAVYLIYESEREKKRIAKEKDALQKKVTQYQILTRIEQKIDHATSVKELVNTIVDESALLYPYTMAAYLLVENEKTDFHSMVASPIHKSFSLQMKNHMISSYETLSHKKVENLVESSSGQPFDETKTSPLESFYGVSLVEDGKIIGLIGLSSTQENAYQEEEMGMLHEIINHCSIVLSKFHTLSQSVNNSYLSICNSLSPGLAVVDTNLRVMLLNDQFKKMLGSAAVFENLEELAGQFQEAHVVLLKVKEAVQNKKQSEIPDLHLKDRIIKLLVNPTYDEQGQITGASLLLYDQTDDKQATKLRDDFSAMVVHELRAPLASMRSAAELLLAKDGKLPKKDQNKLLELMHTQSKRLLDDVSTILDASKLENGKFTILKSQTDIKSLLEKAVDDFKPQAKEKDITLQLIVPDLLPKIWVDPMRIGQVISNLVSNSLKFTAEKGSILVKAEDHHSYIKILVSDTGVGIAKEKQSQLFSKYFQVSHPQLPSQSNPAQLQSVSTVNSSYHNGTGLGLYITKGIVEAHGGTICLESEPGKGTLVWFTLPIQAQKPEEESPLIHPQKFLLTKPASLLVN